jgi:hypothetical protein
VVTEERTDLTPMPDWFRASVQKWRERAQAKETK